MPTLHQKTCSVEGCGRNLLARGYCATHYYRWRKGLDLTTPVKSPNPPGTKCKVKGCGRKHYGHGYCVNHYRRWKRGNDPEIPPWQPRFCEVEGCERKHAARGYCHAHYDRWKKGQDLAPPIKATNPPGTLCSVEGCDGEHYGRGWCFTHYMNWHRYGNPGWMPRTAEDRFWEKVAKRGDHDCWLWTGAAVNHSGYGAFWDGERQAQAHRFSYELHVGTIPEGLFVCHKCDTPGCVNPNHLFLGDHDANMCDMRRKKRHAHGMRHGRAKLTKAQVLEIRRLLTTDHHSRKAIATRFGVSTALVGRIARREVWKHL